MKTLGPAVSRRFFLRRATVATAAFQVVPGHVLGLNGQTPPSRKLNCAGVGLGLIGPRNLRNLESENIVALCDVDHEYAAPAIKRYPNARVWTDYREMLERQKDIDAVVVATPDHTHAVISMAAMRAGKHVYCQKPLCHDIYEARALAAAAHERKVVTQMGIQGHSMESLSVLCEWIWGGAIGEVREVDTWCSLTYYPWGQEVWSPKWSTRPLDTPAVPEKLNWDLWLGPAAYRPYHPAYHPITWRCWWDFGNGMMGDRGTHTLDPVVTALKLGLPTSIEATSCGNNAETHPLSAIVTFRFPARPGMPPVKLTWYEGTRPPRPPELEDGRPMPKQGGFLIKGSLGTIMAGIYGDGPRLIPESAMQAFVRPAKSLPRVNGTHEADWVQAIKEGRPAGAPFAYAAPLTEICLLGNLAIRMDARLEWDAANMKVTNLPAANNHVRTEYRAGWSL